jgi:hypothetical protein
MRPRGEDVRVLGSILMPVRRLLVAISAALSAGLGGCGARTSLAEEVVLDDTPRPIAPLSTSRVTSRRPKLRWTLPSHVTSATIDLCLDRACTRLIGAPVLVKGTSYVPTGDLPSGVVYWRLHPSTKTSLTSATWEFTVGTRSAPVDTSWGTTLDVNGDGYADLVVSATEGSQSAAGAVYVYLGNATGLGAVPATTLTGPGSPGSNYGTSVASAGDVNGDGYADLVVGAPAAGQLGENPGDAYIYLGGPSGLTTTPSTTLIGGAEDQLFGNSVASAGDVNGDGYADLVVGAVGFSKNSVPGAHVFLGSAGGLATAPATTLNRPDGSSEPGNDLFGYSVASAGDVDGDGYADLVVGASGGAYVFHGDSNGIVTGGATRLSNPAPGNGVFGLSVASAGDVNGDGYADVVVGTSGAPYVYLGGPAGIATTPAVSLTLPYRAVAVEAVASAGDVDGDGYGDVVVGAIPGSVNTGPVYVYLGSATGLASAPAMTLTGPLGPVDNFGWSVASAGDVNGDGYADVVVGAWASMNGRGSIFLYLGSLAGVLAPAASTLTGAGPNAHFGYSVFGASD